MEAAFNDCTISIDPHSVHLALPTGVRRERGGVGGRTRPRADTHTHNGRVKDERERDRKRGGGAEEKKKWEKKG